MSLPALRCDERKRSSLKQKNNGVCAESGLKLQNFKRKLYQRWWQAHRFRLAGGESKPPQAAVVKSHGSER